MNELLLPELVWLAETGVDWKGADSAVPRPGD